MIASLKEIDMNALCARAFTPSPIAWEDEVLYFLLIDRFSDNNESGFAVAGNTPLFNPQDNGNAIATDAEASAWREAGGIFTGGNLAGLMNKIPYLKELGITTIWISPVFKQVPTANSYHGYGIQNFLETDLHFGTKEELKELVEKAHAAGIYVILDIIVNHTGNVFSYKENSNGLKWNGGKFEVAGFNNAAGEAALPFTDNIQATTDDAIWPLEFQHPDCYSQKGEISNWDYFPEYLEGDFYNLKDVNLGTGEIDDYNASPALHYLCDVYKYWIAYADIDGYRVDTVKHMDPGAARIFASSIHEFTQKIGKENFCLIGEITGSRQNAFTTLEATGLDAALGIADIQHKLENAVKGLTPANDYFNLFRNSLLVGKESHTWFRNKIVTMVDDHDKVTEGNSKTRFCSNNCGNQLILNALAINVTTLGIPCIYYGSEQLFDGEGSGDGCDRYIRETMFGGNFGAFRTKNRHFFNPDQHLYKELSKILAIRKDKTAIRRGRQYLRQLSGDGINFGFPDFFGGGTEIRSIIPWSRILDNEEIVLAINTNINTPLRSWVTIENSLHDVSDLFECIYSTDSPQVTALSNVTSKNGKAIEIQVPAAGFVIYCKKI